MNLSLIQLSEHLLMKTKTIKTPSVGLMLLRAFVSSAMPLALKACFYAKAIPLSQPLAWFKPTEGKTEKTIISVHSYFFSERSERVFPRMMSLVAKQRVMMAWIVRELAYGHKAMTSARKRKALRHQQRGFLGFC